MSYLNFVIISILVPLRTLSARSAWLEAIKSPLKAAYIGFIFSRSLLNLLMRSGSSTRALLQASYKFAYDISHPLIIKSQGSTIGRRFFTGKKTSSR